MAGKKGKPLFFKHTFKRPAIFKYADEMDLNRINLMVGGKFVTKDEILDIYQNVWKSPRGILWFYLKFGPGNLSFCIRTKIAYPMIYFNYCGQPAYTKDDYEWAQNLFKAEPPVPYDELTNQFLACLFPDVYDIDYQEYVKSQARLMKEIENDPKFQQDCEKFGKLLDEIKKSNTSGSIDMDKLELMSP